MPTVPDYLQARFNQCVARAKPLEIGEERLRQFATIVVAAEYEMEFSAVGEKHAVLARHEIVGERYGFKKGYEDTEAVRQLQAQGRFKSQQLSASLFGVYRQLKKAEKLLADNLDSFPLYISQEYPKKISEIRSTVNRLWQDARPGEDLLKKPLLTDKELWPNSAINMTKESLTFVWWRVYIPPYRGRWGDMFKLARCWKLTDCQEVESFRRRVLAVTEGVTTIRPCPTWATR